MVEPENTCPGETLLYFGPLGLNLEVRVTNRDAGGRLLAVEFPDDHCAADVPCRNLFKADADLVGRPSELARHRAAWAYILDQEGDDLCWRDFYLVAAAVLPEDDASLARLRSMPHPDVMLHNCRKFIASLSSGQTSCYKADSPEAVLCAVQKELDSLKDAYLGDDADRLYHARDDSWWRRGPGRSLVRAGPPDSKSSI